MVDYHTFVFYFRVFQKFAISRVWSTALKRGCIANFDMLFLVMGFISLVDDIQFMHFPMLSHQNAYFSPNLEFPKRGAAFFGLAF